MKQTAQPDASQAQKTAEPARSRPAQPQTAASGGYLTQLAAMINGGPRVQAQRQLSSEINGDHADAAPTFAQAHTTPVQREEDESLAQRETSGNDKSQFNAVSHDAPAQLAGSPAPNRTGLPDQLKSGVENLSGLSLDDVKVHYNSAKPAQLNALAYAQGADIHVAPGQEKHLPHEAWHIVQQKEGRVRPTMQMKQGVQVNDDAGLEQEADVMGAKALQTKASSATATQPGNMDAFTARESVNSPSDGAVAQRATVGQMEGALQEFNSLRVQIYELLQPGEEEITLPGRPGAKPQKIWRQKERLRGEEMGRVLGPLIEKLRVLAEYVSKDDDHEIYKSAYGGIYNFADKLLVRLHQSDRDLMEAPVEDARDRPTALANHLYFITDLMRMSTARVHKAGIGPERRRKDPLKYVASLRRIDVGGAGLESVIAQAAYMSGDMFGVAAALRLDKKLGVVIFYDHLANEHREIEDRLLDFYQTKDGADHPRVSLIPVTDSAAAYKNAIAGDFSNPALFPYGTPSILSNVGSCLSIGNATKIVAGHYAASAPAARAELEKEWLPEGAKEGTAKGRSQKTIAQWVTEKGFDKRLSYAFIWFRQSGARGGAHKELDTSEKATQQIIEVAKSGSAADKLVIIGDKGHSLSKIADIDLTEFWNEADSPFEGSGRKMQLALFAYLVHNEFKIMNIGMRSGALEGPALLGVKTVFLEEKYNFQEGRMDQWQGVVPGFTRIELEHVPTKAGKTELDRLIGLTVEARGAEYLAAVAEINRLRAGTWSLVENQGQILKAAYKRLDAAKGIYEPEDVSTVLTNILKAIETGTRTKISELFAPQKGPILAEVRKAIRALQEWQKAKVKQALVEAYKGPEEGLSGADVEKMWAAIGTRVGGWSAPVSSGRREKKTAGK